MTAPGSAGLLRTVLTLNWLPLIVGPITSTSTMCQSVSLKMKVGDSDQIHKKIKIKTESTYPGSETSLPMVLSKPKLDAAIAAAAIVFTLLGAT